MFSNRVRIVVMSWLVLSVIVFFVRLGPVMARYRSAEQKFADLDFEAKQPAAPVIVNDPHSPRPELTLALAGRAIKGLDEGQMPWAHATLPQRDTLFLVGNQKGYFANLRENRVTFEFPRPGDESGGLYGVAVAQDSHIMATVGEHTVVQFWNSLSGELLATVEDEHPTIAARPDLSEHAKRHPNKLRYQDAGARRIVASRSGCLFAIGKIDGTIELWGNLAYRDHPELLNEPNKADSRSLFSTKQLGFISRHKVHEGQVVDLAFSHHSTKLVSISGQTVTGYEMLTAPDGAPAGYERPLSAPDSKFDLVLSATNSFQEEWRQPLPHSPSQLALSIAAQFAGPSLLRTPFAVAMFHDGILLGDLGKKEPTGTIKFSTHERSAMVQSLAFHRNENALLTLHTSYSGTKETATSETALSLWQTTTCRRIATARLPGQFMSADWDIQGTRLALLRYNPELTKRPATRTSLWPWFNQPTSPFLFHVWDVRLVLATGEREPRDAELPTVRRGEAVKN